MKAKVLLAVLILSLFGLPQVFGQTKLSGKVVMYHYMSQKVKNEGLVALQNEFKKANPDVVFENNLIVQTNYFSTIRQLVAAGETPDIIMGQPSQYPDIIDTGFIKDLTGAAFIKSAGLTKGDINDSSYKGKMYAFPFDFKSYGVFYNKEIFKKLGLSVPKTHAELITISEKIKAAGIDPFIRCYADQVFPDIEVRAYFWATLIKSGQTDAWAQLMAGKKKFSDYPEWTKALELWTQRMKFSRIDDMANDQSKSYDLFVGGKGAMCYQGTWSSGDIMARNPKFDIGFFAIPTDKGPGSFCLQVDDLFMVNGQSAGGKIAQKFMEFCMTPKAAAHLVAGYPPAEPGRRRRYQRPPRIPPGRYRGQGSQPRGSRRRMDGPDLRRVHGHLSHAPPGVRRRSALDEETHARIFHGQASESLGRDRRDQVMKWAFRRLSDAGMSNYTFTQSRGHGRGDRFPRTRPRAKSGAFEAKEWFSR